MSSLEQWMTFIEDRWLLILIVVVVLFIIIKVLNTILKWVLVIAIVGGLVFYGAQYTDAIKHTAGAILEYTQEEWFELMADEIKEARYVEHPDGRYSVIGKSVSIEGKKGEDEVTVTIKGRSFRFKVNDLLQRYIDEVKRSEQENGVKDDG